MTVTADQIDAILPQTQCGLCSFKGCMPYAEALAQKNAAINLCPPGGVKGLLAIAELLNEDPAPFLADMQEKAKSPSIVVIREEECIGCTKCIQACPVDAILGSGKLMHTVIADECTGCELCIAPCPVDCIDILTLPQSHTEEKRSHFRQRYRAREKRLFEEKTLQQAQKISAQKILDRKAYIQAAMLRVKTKNGEKNAVKARSKKEENTAS